MARLSRTGQPTVATWVSGGIALAAVLLGGFNDVAKLVTILFLTLYVSINLSAAFERLAGDPSYRPTIRVPWYVSVLGSLGAVVVMFLISPPACAAALVLELALYFTCATGRCRSAGATCGRDSGWPWPASPCCICAGTRRIPATGGRTSCSSSGTRPSGSDWCGWPTGSTRTAAS